MFDLHDGIFNNLIKQIFCKYNICKWRQIHKIIGVADTYTDRMEAVFRAAAAADAFQAVVDTLKG